MIASCYLYRSGWLQKSDNFLMVKYCVCTLAINVDIFHHQFYFREVQYVCDTQTTECQIDHHPSQGE